MTVDERPFDRSLIGGVSFERTTLAKATAWLVSEATTPSRIDGMPIRLSNAYCVALAREDSTYREVFTGGGFTFPDGAPVAWCQNLLHGREARGLSSRVRGPSLFTAVLDHGRDYGVRHFFLGATADTLQRLEANVASRYHGAVISGRHAPPFGPLDEAFYVSALAAIDAADPQIVWIGMGTPKQDFAAAELARRSGRIYVGVGAAFDFVAGTVTEAHPLIQRSGFEWLYRLAKEPRRLGRRYLVGNSKFVIAVARGWRQSRALARQSAPVRSRNAL